MASLPAYQPNAPSGAYPRGATMNAPTINPAPPYYPNAGPWGTPPAQWGPPAMAAYPPAVYAPAPVTYAHAPTAYAQAPPAYAQPYGHSAQPRPAYPAHSGPQPPGNNTSFAVPGGIIQYVPVYRPPSPEAVAKPPVLPQPAQSQPALSQPEPTQPEALPETKTQETPPEPVPEPVQTSKTQSKPSTAPGTTPGSKAPQPQGFAEETGALVGGWVTNLLKQHPAWEKRLQQFDVGNHLEQLSKGLETGTMPDMLGDVRKQFRQSWVLRHALPWVEKPLLALCPFEYRLPLNQFFKWLKSKPE